MISINKSRLLVIIFSLVITGLLISMQPESGTWEPEQGLKDALINIPEWQQFPDSPIDSEIITTLKLDDYINNTFSKESNQVSLYIGHYNTAKKVGAAHDPTVCFPGQGWILSDKIKGTYQFKSDKEYSIPYSMMVAPRGESKQLIIYWFQSHDIANSNTLSQKFTLIWNRFLHKGESNAFVRVIMPLKGKTVTECKTTILDFITNFYPVYIGYITQHN
ncbi:MAG: EpsI family protein [Desulfobacula sp.]|nr:EpsI family protein [Desulfobacula sp.]